MQQVQGYFGGGMVGKALCPGRKDDRRCLAIARAQISTLAMQVSDLPRS